MILLLAAVPLETLLLRQQLQDATKLELGSCRLQRGSLHNQPVTIAHGGIGLSSMAMQLTRLLERDTYAAVILCGCGGSYPSAKLNNGDLVLAETEIFADLGVATATGFLPMAQLEIPLPEELARSCHASYSLQSPLLDWARGQLPAAGCGPFVSVNCCSGHEQLSLELDRRHQALCENMEGAAAAQVCSEYAIPLLEIRGISNSTGSRDPQQWELQRGAETAQLAVLQLLQNWPETAG